MWQTEKITSSVIREIERQDKTIKAKRRKKEKTGETWAKGFCFALSFCLSFRFINVG